MESVVGFIIESVGSIMPNLVTGSYLIIILSFFVPVLAIAVVIKYRKRTIPTNRFMFVMLGFLGVFSAFFYICILTQADGNIMSGTLGPDLELDFIQFSRIKQIYSLLVVITIEISALIVKKVPDGISGLDKLNGEEDFVEINRILAEITKDDFKKKALENLQR